MEDMNTQEIGPTRAIECQQEPIIRTDWWFDPIKVAAAFEPFAELPLRHNALAVTSRRGSPDPLYEATMAGDECEMEFNVVNEPFRGTIFEEILRALPVPFGRTRLMWVQPQRCYPVHSDQTIRYHLAVSSHPFAYIVFPSIDKVYNIPEDGYLYQMDPREPHTAVNCGPIRRVHLVIVTDQR
jgi:hypothetical protein